MTTDTTNLKQLAQAATRKHDSPTREYMAVGSFQRAANPSTILYLLAELEEARAAQIAADEHCAEALEELSQIERKTIEAAAKVCDEEWLKHSNDPGRGDYYSCADARAEVCGELAQAIRALGEAK